MKKGVLFDEKQATQNEKDNTKDVKKKNNNQKKKMKKWRINNERID